MRSSTGLLLSSLLSIMSGALAATTTTPAAPIGTPTITTNNAIFTLNPNFVITSTPTTRTYDLTVSLATGAPDGVSRKMMVINNQYPAPLIEANEGDTLVINVHNNLPTGQGLHWHGMTQNGTGWADGIPGITQCPIPAGKSFTYRFQITQQYGTYWYHSHMGNTMADGIVGPLIVHSPSETYKRGADYDFDQIIMVGDWMHDLSDDIAAALLSPTGYHGSFAAPTPDSLLVNGVGVYACSSITDGTPCTTRTPPVIPVVPNSRYRFRLINHASHGHFKVSIDSHPLNVTAVDGTDVVGPSALHQLPIGIGQRYDFIVRTNVGAAGAGYYIRSAICTAGLAVLPTGYNPTALAVLRYTAAGQPPATTAVTSSDWSDSVNTDANCYDLDTIATLTPRKKINPPTTVLASNVLSSVVGFITNAASEVSFRFFWNTVTWQNYIYQPSLFRVHSGLALNSSLITNAVFSAGIGAADIIINNQDGFIDHPYHLHGSPFFLVKRGSGALTAATYAALKTTDFSTTNPLRRDTVTIPRSSHAVLRIITDNPGVWPLHCHIGWHLAAGKMAVIVVNPNAVKNQQIPAAATALCDASNIPSGDSADTIAIGRRRSTSLFDPFRALLG